MITKLTSLEELAVKGCGRTVSSAPNFDLDGDGNINKITKSNPSASLLEREELAVKNAIGNQRITFSGYFLSILDICFLENICLT